MTKFRVRLRGRNSPNSPGNTLVTILRMLIITLRIFTYSFTICDSSFYNVADIVPSVSDSCKQNRPTSHSQGCRETM